MRAEISGGQSLQRRLATLAAKTSGPGRKVLMEAAGQFMVGTHVPKVFRAAGPGWPPVPRGGRPLQDTGRLRDSITYRATERDLTVGSNLVYARIQQKGGTIVPRRGRYLAIPCSPPLSVSERRTKGPRDFPAARIFHGPRGLGVYRKVGRGRVEMIFRLVKSVTIKARPYLRFTPEALQGIKRRWIVILKAAP